VIYNTGMIERPDFIGDYLKRINPPEKTNRWKKLKKKFFKKSCQNADHHLSSQEIAELFETMRSQFIVMDERLDLFVRFAPEEIKTELRKELAEINGLLKKKKMTAIRMSEFLDDWYETVELYSNAETVKEIENAKHDFAKGEYVSWQPGMFTKSH